MSRPSSSKQPKTTHVNTKNQFAALEDQIEDIAGFEGISANVNETIDTTLINEEEDNEVEVLNINDTNTKGQSLPQIHVLMFSLASWNIRGLNRPLKQDEVRQMVNENHLSVCAILESHVEISSLANVYSKVFWSWDWTSNANFYPKGCHIILGNAPSVRRHLWSEIDVHKHVNQKPKGCHGILKNLDRIMGNLGFVDKFPGVHAIFQPYRISDHALAIIKFPTLVDNKPKPFKFFNFLAYKGKFIEILANHWNTNVTGHAMYQVSKLRIELDEVQKALDKHLDDISLRDEEAI
ncbi:RNA-directed DNA polymerase, eukaryota, reverse transcriptase zinc-binding domain protein [Tanacetum coccineum]